MTKAFNSASKFVIMLMSFSLQVTRQCVQGYDYTGCNGLFLQFCLRRGKSHEQKRHTDSCKCRSIRQTSRMPSSPEDAGNDGCKGHSGAQDMNPLNQCLLFSIRRL